MSLPPVNAALTIIARAAEIRKEAARGATLLAFELTTTAQKADPIGRAWVEFYGYRPPARQIETLEQASACGHETVVRDANGTVMERWTDDVSDTGQAWVVVGYEANDARAQPVLPATVLWESGDPR